VASRLQHPRRSLLRLDTAQGHRPGHAPPHLPRDQDLGGRHPPRCGNGFVEAGEECDDGNVTSGDARDSSCRLEGLVAQLAAKERGKGGVKAACSVRRFAAGAV
jgi:cysteine-rich repeat protein